LTARVAELERDNAGLRMPPDNQAWRLVVEYAYKVGGEGIRHINSITSHYLAMRDRSAGLEAECSAVGLANTNLQAETARLRAALEEIAEYVCTCSDHDDVQASVGRLCGAALSTAPVAEPKANPIRKALVDLIASAEVITCNCDPGDGASYRPCADCTALAVDLAAVREALKTEGK